VDVLFEDAAWDDIEPGTEALVGKWLVEEGARVAEGQPIAEVVLVKANVEIVAPATGVLSKILVPEQGTFARGTPLAELQVDAA
jgi:pyruvate/2-oxoglutarate dehydrogenase complex dihydrolipoamide acyltransferase (E2) component